MANAAREKVSKATGVKSTCYHMTVGKILSGEANFPSISPSV